MDKCYPETCRLRKSWEYRLVGKMGCKFTTPHFVLLVSKNDKNSVCLGITVSRKVGNAVQRNRLKRLIREFFRHHKHVLPNNKNYSVIVKRGTSLLPSTQIYNELKQVFMKTIKNA